jgi:hypothetical protein
MFGDIEGKLELLRVECTKCARKGRVDSSNGRVSRNQRL